MPEIKVEGLNAKYFSESGIMQIEAEKCSETEEERIPEKVWIQFSATQLVYLYLFMDEYYETSIRKNADDQFADAFNAAPDCPKCGGTGSVANSEEQCDECGGYGVLLKKGDI